MYNSLQEKSQNYELKSCSYLFLSMGYTAKTILPISIFVLFSIKKILNNPKQGKFTWEEIHKILKCVFSENTFTFNSLEKKNK